VLINLINIKYNFNLFSTQFNNDDSMEWEDIIETDDIVEKVNNKIFFIHLIFNLLILIKFHKVNNLRRTKHEYEPREWTPDSIMHCDRINYCLVIDTNILLSDLKSITILIDKYLTGKLLTNAVVYI